MKLELTKQNSSDIGFSSSSLIAGALTFDESKEWIYYVIEHSDEVPNYFFDILDLKERPDYTRHIREVLGFRPSWGVTEEKMAALIGIGYKRFPEYSMDNASKASAIKALEESPDIDARFRSIFPFIEW